MRPHLFVPPSHFCSCFGHLGAFSGANEVQLERSSIHGPEVQATFCSWRSSFPLFFLLSKILCHPQPCVKVRRRVFVTLMMKEEGVHTGTCLGPYWWTDHRWPSQLLLICDPAVTLMCSKQEAEALSMGMALECWAAGTVSGVLSLFFWCPPSKCSLSILHLAQWRSKGHLF